MSTNVPTPHVEDRTRAGWQLRQPSGWASRGGRMALAASLALHAIVLGAASMAVSRGGSGVRAAGEEEARLTLDLRATGQTRRTEQRRAEPPAPVREAPRAHPAAERLAADRGAATRAAWTRLNRLATAYAEAILALPAEDSFEDQAEDVVAREPARPGAGSEPETAPSTARESEGAHPPADDRGSAAAEEALTRARAASSGGAAASDPPAASDPLVRAELLDGPAPLYPTRSARAGEKGDVRCRLHVGADGRVERVDVLRGSGFAALDEAARAGLLAWRFRPARVGDRAVDCEIEHTVSFRLR